PAARGGRGHAARRHRGARRAGLAARGTGAWPTRSSSTRGSRRSTTRSIPTAGSRSSASTRALPLGGGVLERGGARLLERLREYLCRLRARESQPHVEHEERHAAHADLLRLRDVSPHSGQVALVRERIADLALV